MSLPEIVAVLTYKKNEANLYIMITIHKTCNQITTGLLGIYYQQRLALERLLTQLQHSTIDSIIQPGKYINKTPILIHAKEC